MSAREKFLEQLIAFDKQLAERGVPPLSRFWKRALASFFKTGRRRLVVRVGRRGGKSLTLCKLAVAWALFGAWRVAVGDVAIIPFVSVDRTEAAARLRTIATYLEALGIAHVRRSDEIELSERGVIFRVVTAAARTAVGFTSIAIFCDEVARWRDTDTGANPAREIIASLTPTMATVPDGFMLLSSSPWSTNDYHAVEFARGDDDHQCAVHAPTWEANPTITEAQTHALEPDLRVWSREFAAIPSDAVASIIGGAELDDVTTKVKRRAPEQGGSYVVLLDVGLRNDRTAFMVAHRELRERGGVILDAVVVDAVKLLTPGLFGLKRVSVDDVVTEAASLSRAYGGATVYSDLHYADSIRPLLQQRQVAHRELAMASPAQSARITALLAHLSNRTIDLVDDEELRKEILQAQLVHHPGGRLTLSAPERRGAHDDLLDCLLLACDPSTVARLRPIERDLVVRAGPVLWDSESRTISQDVRYYRRNAAGGLVPGEPPYGSPAFIEMARELRLKGSFTPTTARWFRENPDDGQPAPIVDEDIFSN